MILLKNLTIAEKAALLEGFNSWWTNSVPRLNIPAIYLTDGPVGVRKKIDDKGEGAVGLGVAYPSTAFPAPSSIANSWNTDNAEKMGYAIGEEAVGLDVQVILGPGLNLKRDPRCGRNFEYYSEDPLLSGKMAAAFTHGVQKTGTAACAKHFALNNCENYRYMSDSVIDERAARELY
jgi:beta-glucosidase